MPQKPKRPCNAPGCPELSDGRFCATHARSHQQKQDERRGSAASRGYGSRWRRRSKLFLKRHPLCVHCEQEGQLIVATEVDHIVPHRGNYDLFWDEDNWQGLCKSHHSAKTAKEDGGFGR